MDYLLELIFGWLLQGVALFFGYLAKQFPKLGILLGVGFVAMPFLQWLSFDKKYFYTDGSPAGLVLLAVYAMLGLVCFGYGALMIKVAIKTISGENVDVMNQLTEGSQSQWSWPPEWTRMIKRVLLAVFLLYLIPRTIFWLLSGR